MMMKWGRKETSSSSYSSRVPYLARVLPTAWLSRFKRTSINSEPKPAKEKHKGINSSVTRRLSKFAGTEERVYGEDFWRLSFGEHSADGKTSKRVPQPAWYDSDDELEFVHSSCQSCGSYAMNINEKKKTKISNIASSVRTPWILPDMKEFRRDTQILPDMNMYKGEKTTALKTPRSRTTALKTPRSRTSRTTAGKDLKLKKTNERAMEMEKLKRQSKSGKALHKSTKETAEKNDLEKETVRKFPIIERQHLKLTSDHQRKHQHLSTMNLRTSNLRTIQEDHAFPAQKQGENDVFPPEKLSSGRGKGHENEKLKVRTERKSFYMNRELPRRRMKQNTKVRAFSPRTASRVEICKIKALEDLRKAKLKMKAAKQKAITTSGGTRLENFAVVKCSFDPEKDFRNSMIEMIMEKSISRPEELEELLACYLTLNSETYHDLIIKVFQQVWFDLDQPNSDTDLHSEECFHN